MMQRCIVIFLLTGSLCYVQCQSSFALEQTSFPIVDPATQKARDADRRQILEAELQAERQELAKALAALTAGATQERTADVHRRQENIKSLQRELDGVAGKRQAPRELQRVVVKAQRPAPSSPKNISGTAAFWNPYNRAPDPEVVPEVVPEVSADLSTTSRRESQ